MIDNETKTFNALKYKRYASNGIWVNDIWIRPGTIYWVNDAGLLHREGGPAVEWADGRRYRWLNGKYIRGE